MHTTMTESTRLNGLALLNVHSDKHIDIDLDVNKFVRKKKENAFRGLDNLNYKCKKFKIHTLYYVSTYFKKNKQNDYFNFLMQLLNYVY